MPLNSKLLMRIAVVTVAIFVLDWFYMAYITSHQFALKTYQFMVGPSKLSIPLQWLPIVGVVLVALIVWYEVASSVFPRWAGPESDPLSNLRLLRVMILSLTVFVLVLFVPYIIGSNWFWTRMSSLSSITQVHDLALSLLNDAQSIMQLNPLWQYSISQIVAVTMMILTAFLFGRGPRRVKR